MNYQAFTNESLAMMYEGIRGGEGPVPQVVVPPEI